MTSLHFHVAYIVHRLFAGQARLGDETSCALCTPQRFPSLAHSKSSPPSACCNAPAQRTCGSIISHRRPSSSTNVRVPACSPAHSLRELDEVFRVRLRVVVCYEDGRLFHVVYSGVVELMPLAHIRCGSVLLAEAKFANGDAAQELGAMASDGERRAVGRGAEEERRRSRAGTRQLMSFEGTHTMC